MWGFSCFYWSVLGENLNLSYGLKHRTRTFHWYQNEILYFLAQESISPQVCWERELRSGAWGVIPEDVCISDMVPWAS